MGMVQEKSSYVYVIAFCKETRASQAPPEGVGTFTCKTSGGHHVVDADIRVFSGWGESLLGRDTAIKLDILKMGVDVASVKSDLEGIGEMVQMKYPEVFKGVGKLKRRSVQLHIGPDVKPIAQLVRRIVFSMRPKV